MNDQAPNRANLYRLPWSAVDNVNGWIEPTYRCNLRCTACYRFGHEPDLSLEEMKAFVDRTIEYRNCEHISIAGGEPLLVDYLEDLVRYVKSRGCRVTVLTNGVLLDDARLAALKEAGLDRINLHVDAGQDRPEWEGRDETELLSLKQTYLDRIHAHGIQCGLISVLYDGSFRHLPAVIRWAVRNADRLANVTFDLFRYYPDARHLKECFSLSGRRVDPRELGDIATVASERRHTVDEVYRAVRTILPGFSPHSYLNGTQKQDAIKWLLSTAVILDGEILGFLGPKAVEFATAGYHLVHGRYPSFIGGRPSKWLFLAALFDTGVRDALKRYLARSALHPIRLFHRIHTLSVAIVQPSDWYTDGVQNMCDSCPDAILYDGMLVPSCRLDEYKRYGNLVQTVFNDEIPKNHTDLNTLLDRVEAVRCEEVPTS